MKDTLKPQTRKAMSLTKLDAFMDSAFGDACGSEVGELLELVSRFAAYHLDLEGQSLDRKEFIEQLENTLTHQFERFNDRESA